MFDMRFRYDNFFWFWLSPLSCFLCKLQLKFNLISNSFLRMRGITLECVIHLCLPFQLGNVWFYFSNRSMIWMFMITQMLKNKVSYKKKRCWLVNWMILIKITCGSHRINVIYKLLFRNATYKTTYIVLWLVGFSSDDTSSSDLFFLPTFGLTRDSGLIIFGT